MKRRTFLKHTYAAGVLTLTTPAGILLASRPAAGVATLDETFRRPPAAAQPQVWYHWMNGSVTKEGITLDQKPMQRVGIGGVQNFGATK